METKEKDHTTKIPRSIQQNIFWFQITMYQVALVTIIDSGEQIVHNNSHILFCQRTLFFQEFKNIPSLV